MFRVYLFLLFLLSPTLMAQEGGISTCKREDPSQKNYECGSCDRGLVSSVYGNLKDTDGNEYNDGEPGLLDKLVNPDLETNADKKNQLQSVKSIEDIVALMPTDIKKDVVLMSPSRSLQNGPRYLMKSANSEVVFSVNGHPETSTGGGQSIEMLVWDGKTGTYQMAEISMRAGKPQLKKNPRKCMHCHGKHPNIRPVFDPYNFWAHTVPFTRDDLIGGPDEKKWPQDTKEYLGFLDKIKEDAAKEKETGERTRWSVLAPILEQNDPDAIRNFFKNATTDRATYRVQAMNQTPPPPGSNNGDGGPSVRLFDSMYYNNHCRLTRMMKDERNNPAYEQNKFAIAAAVKGCFSQGGNSYNKVKEFFPDDFNNQMERYFKGRYSLPADSPEGSGFEALYNDTEASQNAYFADRVGRKLWATEKKYMEDYKAEMEQQMEAAAKAAANAGEDEEEAKDKILREYEIRAYEAAKEDIRIARRHSELNDKEESLDEVAPLRYVLEASGVDTSLFSMSVDPESYTFGDFFTNMADFGFVRELESRSCKDLANRSKQAFQNAGNRDQLLTTYTDAATQSCRNPWDTSPLTFGNEDILNQLGVATLTDARNRLRDDVNEIFNEEGCAGCHAYGVKGAPPIPFMSIGKLERELTNSSGEIGDLATRIWNRVKRVDGQHGVMPLGGPSLDKDDKDKIKQYLETFNSPYARRVQVEDGFVSDLNQRNPGPDGETNTFEMNGLNQGEGPAGGFNGPPGGFQEGGFPGGGFPGNGINGGFNNINGTLAQEQVQQQKKWQEVYSKGATGFNGFPPGMGMGGGPDAAMQQADVFFAY